MKRYIYAMLCAVAAGCAALITGCTPESLTGQSEPVDGKTIEATFTLSPEFVEEIDVRSVDAVDERTITDVWVIQLNEAGTDQLQAPQYLTTLTAGSRDYKVSVSLQRSASKVYFIANTHNASAYTSATTLAAVNAVTRTIATEADLVSASKNIPMAGVWSGTPDLLGIGGQVLLSRAVAKVNFTLNVNLPGNEQFTLKSVTLKQVPKTLHYYRDAATLDTYPYPATPAMIDYPTATYNKALTNTPESLWWYLPENARGTGQATIQTDKAKADKLPTGQATYCTYIEVTGRYEAAGGTYETVYKIYLGANNTNDYNLKRNTVYNVATTIRGIDAADTRINTVDKSIIVGPFGGWDETKKEYTKLLEVQSVETGKDPMRRWSQDETATGATNIHYGVTNIETLRKLSADLSAYPAAKYCADLGNGWYLPSQNQLMAVWVAYNSIPTEFSFAANYYWSATDSNGSWYVLFGNGSAYFSDYRSYDYQIRCVRDVTPTLALSSTVVTDNESRIIIDSRSLPAKAITTTSKVLSTQATNSAMTPDKTSTDLASMESNKALFHYFAVSKVENAVSSDWLNAYTVCKQYNPGDGSTGKWRLPTQRELMLMWILKDRLTSLGVASFSSGGHWSATEHSNENSWYVNFSNGHTGSSAPVKSGNLRVRCIRDLTPPTQ